MSGPRPWSLDEDGAPEPVKFEAVEPDEVEEGRAYDERGNVRPADARYTDPDGDHDGTEGSNPAPTPPPPPAPAPSGTSTPAE